jgi:hypothetical protein
VDCMQKYVTKVLQVQKLVTLTKRSKELWVIMYYQVSKSRLVDRRCGCWLAIEDTCVIVYASCQNPLDMFA